MDGKAAGSGCQSPYGPVGYGVVASAGRVRPQRPGPFDTVLPEAPCPLLPPPGPPPHPPPPPRIPGWPPAPPRPAHPDAGLPANALGAEKGAVEQIALYVFVVVPFLALAAVIPAVWGWGLSWTAATLFPVFYALPRLGITVGYHRYFTHGSFKANRALRIARAVAGSMAIQGPVVQWVADHRRHHAFSDREGDPHSPWRYGDDLRALAKGMFHAHIGWLFDRRQTNPAR